MVHIISIIHSKVPTSSASVLLVVLIFCFVDLLMMLPWPRLNVAPVCPFRLAWTPFEASTHQSNPLPSSPRVRYNPNVAFRYPNIRNNFFQSSRSGSFTLVVRNDTAVCISGRDLLHRYSALTVALGHNRALLSSSQ